MIHYDQLLVEMDYSELEKRILAHAMEKTQWGVDPVQTYDVEQELQRLDTAIPDTMIELRLQLLDVFLRFKQVEQGDEPLIIMREIARCVSVIADQLQNETHQLSLIREIMKAHTDIFNIEREGGEDIVHDNLKRS